MAEGDLGKVVVGRYDATNPDRPLGDALGHGTQMALIAAGAVSPQKGTDALAVPLVAIRAFDDNGRASNFGLMRSMAYALEKGARVINMSWGTEAKSDFLATAVAYAQSKGAILVASAGNEPTQKAMYPAAYRDVVAVSALDADGKLWKSSNYGSFVSVAAPGYRDFPGRVQRPAGRLRRHFDFERVRLAGADDVLREAPQGDGLRGGPGAQGFRHRHRRDRPGLRNTATARWTPRRWDDC